jgi:hypothetical protein
VINLDLLWKQVFSYTKCQIVLSDCHTRIVVKLGGVIVSVIVMIAVKLCVINLNDHGAQCR